MAFVMIKGLLLIILNSLENTYL